MNKKTIADLKRKDEPSSEEAAKLAAERAFFDEILAELPDDLEAPTISNFGPDGYRFVNAWLTFGGPAYDPDKTFNPVAVLASLEAAGWTPAVCSLAKYGNYRRGVWGVAVDDLPDPYKRGKLTDCQPIINGHIDASTFGNEFECHYRTRGGKLVKVAVKIGGYFVSARRKEYVGGWRYENARLNTPDAWITPALDGEPIAQRQADSRAYLGGDHHNSQSVYGSIYWESITDKPDLSPAAWLKLLLDLQNSKA